MNNVMRAYRERFYFLKFALFLSQKDLKKTIRNKTSNN